MRYVGTDSTALVFLVFERVSTDDNLNPCILCQCVDSENVRHDHCSKGE